MIKEHPIKWIPEMLKSRYPSERKLMEDGIRSVRYNTLQNSEHSKSTVEHFYHKPYAKWEGRV